MRVNVESQSRLLTLSHSMNVVSSFCLMKPPDSRNHACIKKYFEPVLPGLAAWMLACGIAGATFGADARGQTPAKPEERVPQTEMGISQLPNDKLDWILDAKFGMFIHWGLYSGPGRGEWV